MHAGATFWYDRFGTGIIDQVFVWAHECDPKARLAIVEDRVSTATACFGPGDKYDLLAPLQGGRCPGGQTVIEKTRDLRAAVRDMVATLRRSRRLASIGVAETP